MFETWVFLVTKISTAVAAKNAMHYAFANFEKLLEEVFSVGFSYSKFMEDGSLHFYLNTLKRIDVSDWICSVDAHVGDTT